MAWQHRRSTPGELFAVSCSAPASCVAVDAAGDALASGDPAGSRADLEPHADRRANASTAVSCAPSGLCVAVDGSGQALASDDRGADPDVERRRAPTREPLAGVSCLAGGFCMAVDTAGRALAARASPAPAATTTAPTEVTDAGATLAGVVDPNDAILGACSFEYGTAAPLHAVAPLLGDADRHRRRQEVSAQLSGLSAEHDLSLPGARLEPGGDQAPAPT